MHARTKGLSSWRQAGSLFLRNRKSIKNAVVGQQDQVGAVHHSQLARTGTGGGQEQGPEAAWQEQRKEQETQARRSYADVAKGAVTRSILL